MGGGRVQGEGRIAAAPGSLPSVGYNLTALSQDTCRAKTRHPTKTGACGDILTANGNVEAKVVCFYRRRDISSTLIALADKHASE
ncbi:metastasis-associated protein MTA1-like protein [Lates japonicus]|uniref:Metastasis-associated protein MTA1-like protein n=1 Tax=Lates japonicus TaxID=270547 RepID=A0AAD3QWX5_LATJO|nr:metastasis-associated protein MTA1-like protein [Lates japonicus]